MFAQVFTASRSNPTADPVVPSGYLKDLPFTVYDFFAYLASGCVLLWFVSYAFDLAWLVSANPSTLVLLQWIVAAYVAGTRCPSLLRSD